MKAGEIGCRRSEVEVVLWKARLSMKRLEGKEGRVELDQK